MEGWNKKKKKRVKTVSHAGRWGQRTEAEKIYGENMSLCRNKNLRGEEGRREGGGGLLVFWLRGERRDGWGKVRTREEKKCRELTRREREREMWCIWRQTRRRLFIAASVCVCVSGCIIVQLVGRLCVCDETIENDERLFSGRSLLNRFLAAKQRKIFKKWIQLFVFVFVLSSSSSSFSSFRSRGWTDE